jgi:chemosensory pili system protein ChpA (sensor histidine kinase/response regulator)
MSQTDLDLGPLTWVKGEIDLALVRALEAIDKFADNPEDSSQLKFAQTHLHQAHGALSIVGLDGVTQFSEAVEQLLADLEGGRVVFTPRVAATAQQALGAVRQYLDELAGGAPDQPLKLLPAYREVQAARGVERVAPSDLFFPDLSLRPPRRDADPPSLPAEEVAKRLRAERARFERGFLRWLRDSDDMTGVREMRNAVAAIEATQALPAARAFWWITVALLDALAERQVPVDFHVKKLCARIDLQMRRLLEGSRTVAERLMRDALYFVAVARGGGEQVARVQAVYKLAELIPAQAAVSNAPIKPVLRGMREGLAAAKEAWNKFCAGAAVALPQFHDQTVQLASRGGGLLDDHLGRLIAAIAEAANWLRREPLKHNETVAMEVATALLLAESAVDNYEQLGEEFAAQSRALVERLSALARGESLPAMEAPLLDEMSRRAQERLLMSQVAREIQNNLAQVEQALDAFFRDPSQRSQLAALDAPVRQIEGALTIMGQDQAVALLHGCAERIRGFAAPEYQPDQREFEDIAHKLSGLGFFVDALQHGPVDLDTVLQPVQPKVPAAPAEEEERTESVERELERQRREAQSLVEALKDKPENEQLREELKQNLETIRQDASLVADAQLERHAKAALEALAAAPGEQLAAQVEQAVSAVKREPAPVAAPSAETLRLAEAPSEEIDAELLAIFLEEAREVLATIGDTLELSRTQPHNHDYLAIIRRGFHTLKGSGRMVGLSELGEAAWGIEQVMNRWLQLEQDATPALHGLIAEAHALFGAWVQQLEAGGGTHMDASALMAAAEPLKSGAAAAPAAPPAPPAEELAFPALEITLEQPAAETPEQEEIVLPELEPLGAEPVETDQEAAEEIEMVLPEEMSLAQDGVAAEASEDVVRLGDTTVSRALYDMYLGEARQHLTALRNELNYLKLTQQVPPAQMVRAAHTLAGISGTVGIEPVNRLAHALEHTLDRLNRAGQACNSELIGLLGSALSTLDAMVAVVADRRVPDAAEGLASELDRVALPRHAEPAPAQVADVIDLAQFMETAKAAPAAAAQRAAGPAEGPPPVQQPVAEAPAESPAPVETPAEPVPEPTQEAATPAVSGKEEHVERRKVRLQDDIDEQLLPIFLEEAHDLVRTIGDELRQWRAAPDNGDIPNAIARLLHTLKGSARMAGAMGLGELVHAMETRVEQAVAANAVSAAFFDDFEASFDRAQVLIDQLEHPAAAEQPQEAVAAGAPAMRVAEEAEMETAAQRMLRVRAELVDRLVNEAGEMSIARSRIEGEMRTLRQSLLELTENVIRLRNQLREIEIQAESQMQSRLQAAQEAHAEFDPLEFDRFTRFQELTRMMAESVNDVTTVQHNLLKNLDQADAALVSQSRLNRELSQSLMSVRMVPFNSLADRLYRVVRQTAKELGKKANLDIRGGQIELDRSVLEKMTGPLEHLLRNAITHGLEEREQRLALGKPEIGQINLALTQESNEVAIVLSDDGAGLNYERIRAKAIEQGLLAQDQHADAAALTEFIFHPGFSTAGELSELAGRGIGMDVVKSEAASLGGRIEVVSEPGKGASFRIYLPLTLAVAQALLVRTGNRTYAIPSVMVDQVLELKPEAVERIRTEGAAEWLGNRYPYHFLPRLLGDFQSMPEPQRRTWVLLLRGGTQRVAVQVDELRGNQEIVVKNIGPQLARVIGISGATVLGDGEVVLIINPVALASRELRHPVGAAVAAPAAGAPSQAAAAPTVMIVDDSLTVRKITGRLLAREGYHVLTAKDGVDALEQMLDLVPDVLLVDIEMPRMDGFDLTRNVRGDARLKGVPIIMITSRTADKHRNYAKEIGVNHYLGKPYQEEELLELIAGYTRKAVTA